MTALIFLFAGLALALMAWTWSSRGVDGSARLALVVMLGVAATAFNIVIPIPNVEATTTIVLCVALTLGAPTAVAVGIVAVLGTSAIGPIGPWTAWQIAATCLIAVLAAGVGRLLRRDNALPTPLLLGLLAATLTVIYDVVTTVPTALTFATPGPGVSLLEFAVGALLIGIPFTVVHVVCTASLSVLAGPSLIQALERARPQLDGGTIEDVPPVGGMLAR